MSKPRAERVRPIAAARGESEDCENEHEVGARAQRVRAAEELASLEAAFPWSGALPLPERARFARELADHPKRASDLDLDRLLATWRVRAKAYGQGRGFRAA